MRKVNEITLELIGNEVFNNSISDYLKDNKLKYPVEIRKRVLDRYEYYRDKVLMSIIKM